MSYSILELATRSHSTSEVDTSQISFPAHGAGNLAEIEEKHFWFTERRELVLSLLKERVQLGGVGIDVGCGTGYTAVWMTEAGYPTIGVDAMPGFTSLKESGRGFGFLQADLMKMELNPEFDFLLLLDTIEHIERDKDFLQHVCKLLKPGGVLILSVPAFSWLWSPSDDASGHFRRYTKQDVPTLLATESSGLELQTQRYFFGSLLPVFFLSRMLSRLRRDREIPAAEVFPSPLISRIFRLLLGWERKVFRRNGLCLGSSLFVIAQRKS